jgi:phosphoribosyl 1,2-cyclic phosphodiesterase
MRVTLLGSAESIGVPFPLCDCEYCAAAGRRRRPGLLVEAGDRAVVLDTPPEVREALHEAGVADVDGFFLTHAHHDHVDGVKDLHRATADPDSLVQDPEGFEFPPARTVRMYGNADVKEYLGGFEYALGNVEYTLVDDGDAVEVGPITVRPFAVRHGHGEAVPTLGFTVEADGRRVVYVPDLNRLADDDEVDPAVYRGADLLFVDGAVLGAEFHAPTDQLEAQIERVDADRTVLLNLNEHTFRMHHDEMVEAAAAKGYEVWRDLDSEVLG